MTGLISDRNQRNVLAACLFPYGSAALIISTVQCLTYIIECTNTEVYKREIQDETLSLYRETGHSGTALTLEVSVPGATQVRQLSMFRLMQLRHREHFMRLEADIAAGFHVVDLKEAVRLGMGYKLEQISGKVICPVGKLFVMPTMFRS